MKKILDIIENDQKSLMAQYIHTDNMKHREKISQQILALDTILYKTCDIYSKHEENRGILQNHLYKIYSAMECLKSNELPVSIEDIDNVIKEIDLALDISANL